MEHSLTFSGFLFVLGKDAPGYVASAFVLATFCMSAMRPLRMVAIVSNFAFIYYAATADLYPVLILHSILLPVNVTRLAQIELARISGNRLLAQAMSPSNNTARPAFITSQAMADPSTALSLAEREQQRVAAMLSSHLVEPTEAATATGASKAGRTAVLLLDEIDRFLSGVAARGGLSATQSAHLIALRSGDEVLRALREALGELARLLDTTIHLPGYLAVSLREELGAILLIAEDAARSLGPEEIAVLKSMTSDRSALVEQLRSRAIVDGDSSDHRAVYNVTALYERSVWLLRRFARLLEAVVAHTGTSPIDDGSPVINGVLTYEPVI
jgi:hypothetical protein